MLEQLYELIRSTVLLHVLYCITFQMFWETIVPVIGDTTRNHLPAQSASITCNSTGTSASVIRNAMKDFIST